MTEPQVPQSLERRVLIRAPQDLVFHYFTDSTRWAAWWGAGSTIDARPGGKVSILYPGGTRASGEVLEIAAPNRIVFTYGYDSGAPIAAGSSRVTISLAAKGDETQLDLKHDFADAAIRDEHAQGWRYQLSMFANVVGNDLHANATQSIDAWFSAWADASAESRANAFARIATPEV